MDNATEMKTIAQHTKENIEGLANQAEEKLVDTHQDAKADMAQMVDGAKTALGQGVEGAQAQIQTAIADSKDAISQSKDVMQEVLDRPSSLVDDEVKAEAAEVKNNIESAVGKTKSQMQNSLERAKAAPSETLKGLTRQMADAGSADQTSAEELKRRLDWGEPALTILDVRHRESFNQERIRGAISMPEADLVKNASDSLEFDREIFVYGDTLTQADQSVVSLKQAGFRKVASISGGIPAWQNAGGPTEGISA